ncbi:Cytochrome c family protein [Minicystis rosea]|nr:Cytochrome c family protein [Minicystis rosea]
MSRASLRQAAMPLVWIVALLSAVVAAIACRTSEEAPRAHETAPAHSSAIAPADAGVPPGAGPHVGPGSVRCARCHDESSRNHPAWKETAKRIGHDVDRALRDRTTCQCCHLGEVRGFGEPIDRVCKQCHDEVRVTITAMGGAHCLSCHDPSASHGAAIRESAWECQKCHAKDQGQKPAVDVHGGEDCANCHRPHEEPWTIPRRCVECHPGHETAHGKPSTIVAAGHALPPDGGAVAGEAAECSTCHAPHEVGGAASARCAACHAQREPHVFTAATTFAGGHERCTTCHAPHAGDKSAPKPCRTCHASVQTMPGRAAAPHAKCESCHAPHDVRGTPKTACASCHASVHPEHPDPKGEGCVGCHDPHPAAQAAPAKDHQTAANGVNCSHCHTAAANDRAFHDGTTPCKSCHAPHAFKASAPQTCAGCHAQKVAAGAHGGHGACKSCHTPHAPKEAKPACASCHATEAATAPAGHAACTSCHDAHPSGRAPKAACASCHAEKKSGPHAPVACASCHRAHGPDAPLGPPGPATRPSCTGCHEPAKLGSLHAVPAHASSCASCHRAHAPPSAARDVCITCHADKKAHEPTARVCNGCHAFGKAR